MGQEFESDKQFRRNLEYVSDEFMGTGVPFGIDLHTGEPLELEPLTKDETGVIINAEELEEDRKDPDWQGLLDAAKAHRAKLRCEGRIS